MTSITLLDEASFMVKLLGGVLILTHKASSKEFQISTNPKETIVYELSYCCIKRINRLVRGGEATRYCNSCKEEITNHQASMDGEYLDAPGSNLHKAFEEWLDPHEPNPLALSLEASTLEQAVRTVRDALSIFWDARTRPHAMEIVRVETTMEGEEKTTVLKAHEDLTVDSDDDSFLVSYHLRSAESHEK